MARVLVIGFGYRFRVSEIRSFDGFGVSKPFRVWFGLVAIGLSDRSI